MIKFREKMIKPKMPRFQQNSEQREQFGTNENNQGTIKAEKEKEKEKERKKNKKEKILKSDSEAFAAFWEAYPNKKNKAVAVKRWDSLRVTAGLHEKIMAGLAKAKHSMEWAERGENTSLSLNVAECGGLGERIPTACAGAGQRRRPQRPAMMPLQSRREAGAAAKRGEGA